MDTPRHAPLRLVAPDPDAPAQGTPPVESDAVLDGVILSVGAFPLACQALGLGQWDPLSLGLGTLGVIFAAHDLWSVHRQRPRGIR